MARPQNPAGIGRDERSLAPCAGPVKALGPRILCTPRARALEFRADEVKNLRAKTTESLQAALSVRGVERNCHVPCPSSREERQEQTTGGGTTSPPNPRLHLQRNTGPPTGRGSPVFRRTPL